MTAARLAAGMALALALAGCRAPAPSRADFLRLAWRDYVATYVSPEGWVADPTRGDGEVISEAQGYALLRAAWVGDAATFDRVLGWTERTLRRPDGLFMWRWSPKDGGRVLDANTATDGDEEIALALVMASRTLGRPELRDRAASILRAIRTQASIEVPGGWFPAAGNWAVGERVVNLSYFLPFAYDAFAGVDPASGWETARDTGYALIARTLERPGIRLVPDFVVVGDDGRVGPLPETSPLSRDFSFDAMRLWFRVALDCRLSGRPAACDDPLGVAAFAARLAAGQKLVTRWAPDGTPLTHDTSLSFQGSLLPALALVAPQQAAALRAGALSPAQLTPILRAPDRYYDLNWIWFGLAAEEGFPFAPCPPS